MRARPDQLAALVVRSGSLLGPRRSHRETPLGQLFSCRLEHKPPADRSVTTDPKCLTCSVISFVERLAPVTRNTNRSSLEPPSTVRSSDARCAQVAHSEESHRTYVTYSGSIEAAMINAFGRGEPATNSNSGGPSRSSRPTLCDRTVRDRLNLLSRHPIHQLRTGHRETPSIKSGGSSCVARTYEPETDKFGLNLSRDLNIELDADWLIRPIAATKNPPLIHATGSDSHSVAWIRWRAPPDLRGLFGIANHRDRHEVVRPHKQALFRKESETPTFDRWGLVQF